MEALFGGGHIHIYFTPSNDSKRYNVIGKKIFGFELPMEMHRAHSNHTVKRSNAVTSHH
jgi:hypothetical protein